MASTRLRRIAVAVSLTALTTGGAWTLGGQPASAATTDRYVTTSGSDTGNDCSASSKPCKTVQHAVDDATTGDTIHIGAGTYPESVLVGSAESNAAGLTLAGAGAGATKITGDPGGSTPVGGLEANFAIAFQGLSGTVRNLSASGVANSGTVGNGGRAGVGIVATPAVQANTRAAAAAPASQQLELDAVSADGNGVAGLIAEGVHVIANGSHFDHNGTAASTPDRINGAGILTEESAPTVVDSTASSNLGLGVEFVDGLEFGGSQASASSGSGSLTRSTIAHNTQGGVAFVGGTAATVDDSTIASNTGFGLVTEFSTVALTRSTVTGTSKSAVADGVTDGAITVVTPQQNGDRSVQSRARAMTRRVLGSRLANRVRVRAAAEPPASVVTVTSSIVADNTAPACSQKVTDGGYNISNDSKNTCAFSAAKHSQPKTNPELGTLGAHGGPTQTQLPLKLSPAIDAVPAGSAGCAAGAVDQRGVARPQPTGGRCDIGSVELAGAKLAITTASLPHGTVGKDYSASVHAVGGQYPTYTWTLADGSVPGLSFSSGGVFSGKPTKAGTYTVTVSVNDPVTRTYTVVIDAPSSGTNGNGTNGDGTKLADTGVPTQEIAGVGLALLIGGLVALYAAVLLGGPLGRHRRSTN